MTATHVKEAIVSFCEALLSEPMPGGDAADLHRHVALILGNLGFDVQCEVPARKGNGDGRIDVLAVDQESGLRMALELDRKSARWKSVQKLVAFDADVRGIVLREGAQGRHVAPRGLDFSLGIVESWPDIPAAAPALQARAQETGRRPAPSQKPAARPIASQSASGVFPDASAHVTPDQILRAFARAREEAIPGSVGFHAARDAQGKSSDLADYLNEYPDLIASVAPTLRLLMSKAKAGTLYRAAELLKDPRYLFGAWCSQFTALCEELRGVSAVPAAAPDSPDDDLPDLAARWRARS